MDNQTFAKETLMTVLESQIKDIEQKIEIEESEAPFYNTFLVEQLKSELAKKRTVIYELMERNL